MNITAAELCLDPTFKTECHKIYGGCDPSIAQRFIDLANSHKATFNADCVEFFSSPGRIEIVGNHTDHNGGKVLCAAINFDTLAAVSYRDDGVIEVKSAGYPMLKVDSAHPDFSAAELGTSMALIKGVLDYFIRSGKKVGGFSASMTSTVPKAAGVSSSSSFELAIAEILNVRYNDGALDPIFKAKASQYAEHAFFGKPCGLMDQSAIALGGVNMIDFSNFENPAVERAQWSFDDLDIYVVSTGGDHSNLNDDYAAIPNEMKEVASKLGAKYLAEISPSDWQTAKDGVRNGVSARAFSRAEHFFEENRRVEDAVAAIDNHDENKFLDIVNKSGISSREKLQNIYSETAKNRNLSDGLYYVAGMPEVLASRVHGGGFAGTMLLFARKGEDALETKLRAKFGGFGVFKLAIRDVGATRLFAPALKATRPGPAKR